MMGTDPATYIAQLVALCPKSSTISVDLLYPSDYWDRTGSRVLPLLDAIRDTLPYDRYPHLRHLTLGSPIKMLTVITRQRAFLRSLSMIRRLAVRIPDADIEWDFRNFPRLILLEAALVLTGNSPLINFDDLLSTSTSAFGSSTRPADAESDESVHSCRRSEIEGRSWACKLFFQSTSTCVRRWRRM
jgi:hypothetical protein